MQDLIASLKQTLIDSGVLGLCTVDDAGEPYASNLRFAVDDDLNCYFLSSPASAHSRHAAARPSVAASAYAPFAHPGEIHGVQMRGTLTPLPADQFDACWAMFCERYPAAKAFEEKARTQTFYRLTPSWLRLIDNRVSFGFKQETRWPAEA